MLSHGWPACPYLSLHQSPQDGAGGPNQLQQCFQSGKHILHQKLKRGSCGAGGTSVELTPSFPTFAVPHISACMATDIPMPF